MFFEKIDHLYTKYNFIISLVFIFSFSEIFSQTKKEADWQLKKHENGIAVYTRDAANSKFKELKSVAIVKSSLSSIVFLLNDWESYPEWVYKCGKSFTLKKISDTEVIHYQTVEAPWPVDNRDFVVNVKLTQNEKTKIVNILSTCKPDYIPKILNHVRIDEFKASWTLIPLKDGTVEIIYQLLVNPGGNIPAWLVNMAVVDGPFETCENLKTHILKEKYQKAIVSYIKDVH